MKLFRHGPIGHERPGVVSPTGRPVDVSAFGEDYDEVFFAERGLERLAAWLATYDCPEVPSDARIGAPIARPSKIVCIGLNYRAHADEAGIARTPQGTRPPAQKVSLYLVHAPAMSL